MEEKQMKINKALIFSVLSLSHGSYTNGRGNCAHEADETIIGVRPAIWVKSSTIKTANENKNS